MTHPQIVTLVHATATQPAHVMVVVGDQMVRVEFVGNADLNLLSDLTEHIRRKYGVHPLRASET